MFYGFNYSNMKLDFNKKNVLMIFIETIGFEIFWCFVNVTY